MPPAPPTAETVAPHSGPGPGPGRWRGRRSLGPSPAAPLTGISGASCPRRVGISPRPGPLEQTPRGDPAGPRKRVATDPRVGRSARLPHPERCAGAGRAPPACGGRRDPPPLLSVELRDGDAKTDETGRQGRVPPLPPRAEAIQIPTRSLCGTVRGPTDPSRPSRVVPKGETVPPAVGRRVRPAPWDGRPSALLHTAG